VRSPSNIRKRSLSLETIATDPVLLKLAATSTEDGQLSFRQAPAPLMSATADGTDAACFHWGPAAGRQTG
jgi:hypothetical protein